MSSENKDRREFIKLAGTALLVTSGISVIGLTSSEAKPKNEGEENRDDYFSDGYYDDGYYDDGYTTGLGGVNEDRDNLRLAALPNPSNGNFELVINAKAFELSNILISDLSGKMILHQKCFLRPGENRISFESNSFAHGIYAVVVAGEKSAGTLRLVITK